jgi:sigma-B regulation protein RsbU (phosphoserine phosphatase)
MKNAMVNTNNYIVNNHADMNMFVTLFFGVLDPVTGALTYVNGGHESPMIVNGSGEIIDTLPTTGPAIGLFPGVEYGLGHAQIDPGDTLFCFTDGVPDARNPAREQFGRQRLQELLQQPTHSAANLLNNFEMTLQMHIANAEQFDDITMLAVRRNAE